MTGFNTQHHSLYVDLFEERYIWKGSDHVLVDHLPQLVIQEELMPGTLHGREKFTECWHTRHKASTEVHC